MPKVLSQEQIAAYQYDGFISPVTIMSSEEANQYKDALEEAESKWPEAFGGAGRNNAHLVLKFLDELTHDSRILDAVEDLIGENILVYGTVLFVKEPDSPAYVSWHQDVNYMGLTPHDGVSIWLALSPSNAESGCMQMIPGSHVPEELHEQRDTYGDENILTRGQTIDEVDESTAVDLILEPGQMSLHHLRTIHSSKPNRSNHRRIGFVVQCYMPPHMRQPKITSCVQLARGIDEYKNFPYLPRAQSNMHPDDIKGREHNNALWADILYDGAQRRRNY